MKTFVETIRMLLLPLAILPSGICINPFSYHPATTKCLPETPLDDDSPSGGLVLVPGFKDGVDAWRASGNAVVREEASGEGNRFIVIHNRSSSTDGVSQRIQLRRGHVYSFSAWVQGGDEASEQSVRVVFKTGNETSVPGGEVISRPGCWSLLTGGIVANSSGPVDMLLETKNSTGDVWIARVSFQSFTKAQWRFHQDEIIDKIRKSKVRFHVSYPNKTVIEGAKISIEQLESSFPFGCGINFRILQSKGYQGWFSSRFKVTSFTNEMKWYTTEKQRGQENYTLADAMLEFARKNGISVRGHNILWDDPKMQPSWVHNIVSAEELMNVTVNRIQSVVSRYEGKLIGWDVVNENVHFKFFEDKLGANASSYFYSLASKVDPQVTMFMNEFNTIENSKDMMASALNYKKKLQEILAYPGNEGLKAGIGLQGHFGAGQPNIAYMRSALNTLGATGFPIWLTEVDNLRGPDQERYLEEILREAYSHPAVEGIIIFGGPEVSGFVNLTLADGDFKNTPAGDVVDKLIGEWRSGRHDVFTDGGGTSAEVGLFHGHYSVTVRHPSLPNLSTTLSLKLTRDVPLQTVHLEFSS